MHEKTPQANWCNMNVLLNRDSRTRRERQHTSQKCRVFLFFLLCNRTATFRCLTKMERVITELTMWTRHVFYVFVTRYSSERQYGAFSFSLNVTAAIHSHFACRKFTNLMERRWIVGSSITSSLLSSVSHLVADAVVTKLNVNMHTFAAFMLNYLTSLSNTRMYT